MLVGRSSSAAVSSPTFTLWMYSICALMSCSPSSFTLNCQYFARRLSIAAHGKMMDSGRLRKADTSSDRPHLFCVGKQCLTSLDTGQPLSCHAASPNPVHAISPMSDAVYWLASHHQLQGYISDADYHWLCDCGPVKSAEHHTDRALNVSPRTVDGHSDLR